MNKIAQLGLTATLLGGCLIKADGPAIIPCDQANCVEVGEPIFVEAGTDDAGTPLLHLTIDGTGTGGSGEAPELSVFLTWDDGFGVAAGNSIITQPIPIDGDEVDFGDVVVTLDVDDTETLFLDGQSEDAEMTWSCQALTGGIACGLVD